MTSRTSDNGNGQKKLLLPVGIVIALLTAAITYGELRQTVAGHGEEIRDLKAQMQVVQQIHTDVTRIKALLERGTP